MTKLRQHNRPKKNLFIIGKRNVLHAIESGKQLERIYLQNNLGGNEISYLNQLAVQHKIPVNKVPIQKIEGFNIINHDGCVALVSQVQYYDLQEVISFVIENGQVPLLLILDGITDIRNIGGIARTAFCTGVHALIIPDKGVGMLNEDAVLTSAGALEKLPVCRVGSLMKTVDDLHLNGIKVFASEMTSDKKIFDCDFKVPCAIIMGSEAKGIYPALLKVCDESFRIPMHGNFESLNVSVAAGMILYEAMKQRSDNS
ncbi:MAG: 23S rRNA (guanosine(2251)-2'-O)-methyltransferase RlmB [Chitinophagaceae bacterium]